MKKPSVRKWLAQWARRQFQLCAAGTAALPLIGLIVVFFTYWFIFGIMFFGCLRFGALFNDDRLHFITAAIIVALFVGNAVTDRRTLDHIEIDISPQHTLHVGVARAAGYGWALAFAGPKTFVSTMKMMLTLLYSGPRCFTEAWHLYRRTMALKTMDTAACGQVLSLLLKEGRRVPFTVIARKFTAVDLERVLLQLQLIDGVVVLQSAPAGLAVAPKLVEEIVDWRESAMSE